MENLLLLDSYSEAVFFIKEKPGFFFFLSSFPIQNTQNQQFKAMSYRIPFQLPNSYLQKGRETDTGLPADSPYTTVHPEVSL